MRASGRIRDMAANAASRLGRSCTPKASIVTCSVAAHFCVSATAMTLAAFWSLWSSATREALGETSRSSSRRLPYSGPMNVTPVRLPPGGPCSPRDRCVREMRLDRTRSGSLSSPAWRTGSRGFPRCR